MSDKNKTKALLNIFFNGDKRRLIEDMEIYESTDYIKNRKCDKIEIKLGNNLEKVPLGSKKKSRVHLGEIKPNFTPV